VPKAVGKALLTGAFCVIGILSIDFSLLIPSKLKMTDEFPLLVLPLSEHDIVNNGRIKKAVKRTIFFIMTDSPYQKS
jgi:hypothetical protein